MKALRLLQTFPTGLVEDGSVTTNNQSFFRNHASLSTTLWDHEEMRWLDPSCPLIDGEDDPRYRLAVGLAPGCDVLVGGISDLYPQKVADIINNPAITSYDEFLEGIENRGAEENTAVCKNASPQKRRHYRCCMWGGQCSGSGGQWKRVPPPQRNVRPEDSEATRVTLGRKGFLRQEWLRRACWNENYRTTDLRIGCKHLPLVQVKKVIPVVAKESGL